MSPWWCRFHFCWSLLCFWICNFGWILTCSTLVDLSSRYVVALENENLTIPSDSVTITVTVTLTDGTFDFVTDTVMGRIGSILILFSQGNISYDDEIARCEQSITMVHIFLDNPPSVGLAHWNTATLLYGTHSERNVQRTYSRVCTLSTPGKDLSPSTTLSYRLTFM